MPLSLKGRMSVFGGPDDLGVGPDEGLALVDASNFESLKEYFLPNQPPGTTGLARRLDPGTLYIACRWDYGILSKAALARSFVSVTNPENGLMKQAKPIDWGPAQTTGRVADLSPELARLLDLRTDDIVVVNIE
jgi:hypothetical protein